MKPGQPFYWEDSHKGRAGPPKRSLKILVLLGIVVCGLLVSRLPFLHKDKEAEPSPSSNAPPEQSEKIPRLFVGEPSCERDWLKDSSEVLLRCGRHAACAECLPASAARNIFLRIVEQALERIASPESLHASLNPPADSSSQWSLASLNFRKSGRRFRFSGTPIPLSRSSLWSGGFRFCSGASGCLGGAGGLASHSELGGKMAMDYSGLNENHPEEGPETNPGRGAEDVPAYERETSHNDTLLSTSYWPMPHLLITAVDSLSLTVPFPGTVSEIRLNHSGGERVQVFHKGGLFSYYEGRFYVREDLALGAVLDENSSVGIVEAGQKVRFFMEDRGLYVDPMNFKSRLAAKFYGP